ncbi:MAG: hypothetical protein GY794_25420 [bacterium]|nr:hypothetical protein [bacterium]
MMSIHEIEEKYIQPLSTTEKLQLIQDVIEMLKVDSGLTSYFEPGQTVSYHGPVNEPRVAARLEELLQQ